METISNEALAAARAKLDAAESRRENILLFHIANGVKLRAVPSRSRMALSSPREPPFWRAPSYAARRSSARAATAPSCPEAPCSIKMSRSR